jgi:hypothetical protein
MPFVSHQHYNILFVESIPPYNSKVNLTCHLHIYELRKQETERLPLIYQKLCTRRKSASARIQSNRLLEFDLRKIKY